MGCSSHQAALYFRQRGQDPAYNEVADGLRKLADRVERREIALLCMVAVDNTGVGGPSCMINRGLTSPDMLDEVLLQLRDFAFQNLG